MSTDPHSTTQTVPYPERIVTFIDILGFTGLVRSAADPDRAGEIIRTIEDATSAEMQWGPMVGHEVEAFTCHVFSDSACFAAPANRGGFHLTVMRVMSTQARLARKGLLVRGGIALGRHYESARMLFSEGLVRAYEVEKDRALYPRVVLDREVLDRFLRDDAEDADEKRVQRLLLLQDSDKEVFVHYLSLIGDPAFEDSRRDYLAAHAEIVRAGYAALRDQPRVLQKLGWLHRYHDFTVRAFVGRDLDLLIGGDAAGFGQLSSPASISA